MNERTTCGFTLIELLICVSIFIIMTALLVAKYGNFNQSTLLTDTAYDIALALHTAQSYGLSVKDSSTGCGFNPMDPSATQFDCAYGVDFYASTAAGSGQCGQTSPTPSDYMHLTLFTDLNLDHICTSNDSVVNTYTISRGAFISGICVSSPGSSTCTAVSDPADLDVTYQRPYPDATICLNGRSCGEYNYAQVTLQASDGSTRTIGIYQNGQIVVNQ